MQTAVAKALIDCGLSDLKAFFRQQGASPTPAAGPSATLQGASRNAVCYEDRRLHPALCQWGKFTCCSRGSDLLAKIRNAHGSPNSFAVVEINPLFARAVATVAGISTDNVSRNSHPPCAANITEGIFWNIWQIAPLPSVKQISAAPSKPRRRPGWTWDVSRSTRPARSSS
jgi:hypothetical protein